jgi:hypothetical protein
MMKLVLGAAVLSGLAACLSTDQNQNAVTGSLLGAGAGALIGALAIGRAGGVLAGAAIGVVSGAAIGAASTPPGRRREDEYGNPAQGPC